jgi:sec-independent protein translocase protein TatC
MGVINHRFLIRYFRHAILLIFIAAAILTPTPDAASQILLGLPLVALYGLSILVSYLVKRRSKNPPAVTEEQE